MTSQITVTTTEPAPSGVPNTVIETIYTTPGSYHSPSAPFGFPNSTLVAATGAASTGFLPSSSAAPYGFPNSSTIAYPTGASSGFLTRTAPIATGPMTMTVSPLPESNMAASSVYSSVLAEITQLAASSANEADALSGSSTLSIPASITAELSSALAQITSLAAQADASSLPEEYNTSIMQGISSAVAAVTTKASGPIPTTFATQTVKATGTEADAAEATETPDAYPADAHKGGWLGNLLKWAVESIKGYLHHEAAKQEQPQSY